MSAKPTDIKLLQKSRRLEIQFDDGQKFSLSCEYLRVHSPSAEVRGHGKKILQIGKQDVNIIGIDPVGNYAIRLVFDDGHNSGIYSWETLYDLSVNQEKYWQTYLEEVAA
ncbi:MAG: DUF971 domain-containing protein [Gammaproteobacteria bacterium]